MLKGRLCYTVDVNEFIKQVDSDKLMSHGLAFMMDYNEDRLGLKANTPLKTEFQKDLVDMKEKSDNKKDAMLYIETLGMHNLIFIDFFTFFS